MQYFLFKRNPNGFPRNRPWETPEKDPQPPPPAMEVALRQDHGYCLSLSPNVEK